MNDGKCVKCHEEYDLRYVEKSVCACGGTLKPIHRIPALHSGDIDRELGYKYVPGKEDCKS
jgi:hypothetical protein